MDKRGGDLLMLAGRDGLSDGGSGLVPIAQTLLPAVLPPADTKSFALTTARALLTSDYGAESCIARFDDDAAKNVAGCRTACRRSGDLMPLGKLSARRYLVLLKAQANNRESPPPILAAPWTGRHPAQWPQEPRGAGDPASSR